MCCIFQHVKYRKKNHNISISLKYSKPVYETLFEIHLYISVTFLFFLKIARLL